MRVATDVGEKLVRIQFINAGIKSDEALLDDDKLITEYRSVLAEMVETFLPLGQTVLLTANINIEDIDDLYRYSTLTGKSTMKHLD